MNKKLLDKEKKEKQMREGYLALRDVSRSIVRGYKSLQKKVLIKNHSEGE